MIDFLIIVLICVIMGSFGQIYMKMGLKETGGIELNQLITSKLFTIIFNKYVFTGVVLYLLATLLWFVVLSKAELSFAYPLISLGYVLTAVLAIFYFQENVTLIRWLGIVLILSGVFLITRS